MISLNFCTKRCTPELRPARLNTFSVRVTCCVIVLPPTRVAARAELVEEAANHAAIVDARVLEEVLVLGRENGLDKQRRKVVVSDRRALHPRRTRSINRPSRLYTCSGT